MGGRYGFYMDGVTKERVADVDDMVREEMASENCDWKRVRQLRFEQMLRGLALNTVSHDKYGTML